MRRYTLFILLLISFLLTGCLVDGIKQPPKDTQSDPNKPGGEYFFISGRVVKGVLDGALITVHPYVAGEQSEAVVEVQTNQQGYYEAWIPRQYLGSPARIRASAGAARMKCDLFAGCGNRGFGEWVAESVEDLVLDLAVPELQASGVYNVSVLTHMAQALAAQKLSARDDQGNGLANASVKMEILSANSNVASAFGIIGELSSLTIIDLADADARALAKPTELYYALMNSVAVAAAMDVYEESDFVRSLNRLADQFIESGIPGNSVAEVREVTQFALLETLENAYRHIEGLNSSSYSEERSEIAALRSLFLSESTREYGRGVSSNSAHLTFVEKAKLMVRSVREVALSMDLRRLADLNSLSGILDGDVSAVLKAFGVVVDASQILEEERVDKIQGSLSAVGQAVLEAMLLYYQKQPIPSTIQGVRIAHYPSATSHRFVIGDEVNICDTASTLCRVPVDLEITLGFSSFGASASTSSLQLDDFKLTINGFLGDAGYRIHFSSNKPQLTAGALFLEGEPGAQSGRIFFEVQNWQAMLPFNIVAQGQDAQSSLSGTLMGGGEELVLDVISEEEVITGADAVTETISTNLYQLSHLRKFHFNIAFSVEVTQRDRFSAAINLSQGNVPFAGKAIYKSVTRKACGIEQGSCVVLEDNSGIEGEEQDNFVHLSASAAYKATLKAYDTPVLIQLTGSRESPSINKISNLKLSYPGHAISLNGRFNNNGGIIALDAINLDGMHLYFNTINGKRTGTVETPTKEPVADIIDMGEWVKVRYVDGYFESLL